MDEIVKKQILGVVESQIYDAYHNKIEESVLPQILEAFRLIKSLSLSIDNAEIPIWFTASYEQSSKLFFNYYLNVNITRIKEYLNEFLYGRPGDLNGQGFFYSLPFLRNWYDINIVQSDKLNSAVNVALENKLENFQADINDRLENFDDAQESLNKSLEIINKEVGKIAVKEYAGIFEDQANEHSLGIRLQKKWFPINMGRAQKWISIGFILLALLVSLILNMDNLIKIEDSTWTPKAIIHIFGRAMLLSLVIFLISFSFKQYRINMHLSTVNKHRANTLKSFEYLTKAPDKLEGATYNAILMEVAKSIYESGQTGYITTNEINSDMPSIIDMTKVITSNK